MAKLKPSDITVYEVAYRWKDDEAGEVLYGRIASITEAQDVEMSYEIENNNYEWIGFDETIFFTIMESDNLEDYYSENNDEEFVLVREEEINHG